MKVFIIEDEQLGVERLEKQLKEIDPSIDVLGSAESIKASVDWLQQNPAPDLILMDIELTDGQSFEIFRKVEVKSPVIFVTSYDEYTLQAFRVNSIDYLLKPIKKDELKRGIEKLHHLRQLFQQSQTVNIEQLVNELQQQQFKNYRNRFLVKQGQRLVSVEVMDIAYFYIEGRLTFFRTWDEGKYVVDYALDEIGNMLRPADFHRVNRGFLVHSKSVYQIHNHFNGKLRIELNPPIDKEVLISRESAAAFKAWMGK